MSAWRRALLMGPSGAFMVSRWCLVGNSVLPWWCLSRPGADTRCLGRILVASCWWCRGGCAGGRLVVSRRRFPACCSNLGGIFWVGHTMPQVIVRVLSCCHADNHDSS